MNASLGILRAMVANNAVEPASKEQDRQSGDAAWNAELFAQEQIRGLIRRVFLPGWPRPSRQVVFSAADSGLGIAGLCRRVGEMLAAEDAGKVCLIDASLRTPALEQVLERTSGYGDDRLETAGAVPNSSRQLSENLWLVRGAGFVGPGEAHSAFCLRARLRELRKEFDYAVIHAGSWAETGNMALLAHLADGLVLGLEANRTRRLTAQKIHHHLRSANVRLLGVVLSERTFPIPEKLYRRL
jgi:hypothetical protein